MHEPPIGLRRRADRGAGSAAPARAPGSRCCAVLKMLPVYPSYPSIVWVGRVFAPKLFEEHDDVRKALPFRLGGRAFQS